jgi:hypothetical protein
VQLWHFQNANHSTIEKSHSRTKSQSRSTCKEKRKFLPKGYTLFSWKQTKVSNCTRNNPPSWWTLSLCWWRNQHTGKGTKLRARRKERFFVKRHSIVKSLNKHTSCGLSLCIGGEIDMEKAPKQLGWSLEGYFFLRDFLVGLKSSYLAIHEDFPSDYS